MRIFTLFMLCCLSPLFMVAQSNHVIEITGFSFMPNELTIEQGDTVTWMNLSSVGHNVNGTLASYANNPEGFANGAVSSADWTYQHVFNIPGFYDYRCDPHFGGGMVGTITVNGAGGTPNIVITEIMYNPPESGIDQLEFVELYNNGTSTADLSGYAFTQGFEFSFPEGFMLDAGAYAIIASNATEFEASFGISAMQVTSGSLSNGGEDIILVNPDSTVVIDEVDYDDGGDWPTEPDGDGSSLVLCDVDSDNNLAGNWAAANTPAGFSVNNMEVYANPNAASACPTGPVVGFLFGGNEVSEDAGSVTVGVVITGGDDQTNTIDVAIGAASSATDGVDFTIMPSTLTFTMSEAVDTQYVTVTITDDAMVESLETVVLELTNPSAGVTVSGPNSLYTLNITDNDTNIPGIVITEIMYNPPGDDALYEYIELYNNDVNTVNVGGYYFSAGIVDTLHDIDLLPGDYLLLAVDSVAIEAEFGVAAFQWTDGGISNGGELVELRDPLGNVVDVVEYDDAGDWPEDADGSGAALVLCDPSSDNSLGVNWIAGVEPSGVFLGGTQVLGSPGAPNDCTPPEPTGYSVYTIGEVDGIDADGVADSLGVQAELTGIVYGVNLRPGGLQFTIIDAAGDGMATFSNSEDFGFTVTESDEVTIQGVIGQFNGLTQINIDTVWMNSAGNALVSPTVVTVLNEDSESQLVELQGVTVDGYVDTGGALNVTVTDGGGVEHLVRVDLDTDITEAFIMGTQGSMWNITGIGGQFDGSAPHDEGYQLFPRYQADFEIIISTTEPEWASIVRLAPNPVKESLRLTLPFEVDQVQLFDAFGRLIQTHQSASNQLSVDMTNLAPGNYFIRLIDGNEAVTRKVIKQ